MIKKSSTLTAVLAMIALIMAGTALTSTGNAFAQAPVPTVSSPPPRAVVLPAKPIKPKAVLWDQPLSTVNQGAYVDQEFPDSPTFSSFLADDFSNGANWTIDTIFVPGNLWNGGTTLANATSLTWQIYADNAGVPAGDPSGGGSAPFWTLSLPPADSQVTLETGTDGYPSNATLALTTPITLPAGTWWLVFYPTMAFTGGGQYGRQPADTTNGYTGQFINPGGAFGYGTAWQAWTVIGMSQTDIAFRIEGSEQAPSMLQNPSFENGGWMPDFWAGNGNTRTADKRDCTEAQTGQCSFKLSGSGRNKRISQYALDRQGKAVEGPAGPYSLSLWTKTDQVAATGNFRIVVVFYYGDGTRGANTLDLPRGTHDWQETTGVVTASQSFTGMRALLEYGGVGGTVYFDDVTLWFQPSK